MSSGDDEEYTFHCPECAETLEVNDSMRGVLIEKGCVICGATLTPDAFTPSSTSRST